MISFFLVQLPKALPVLLRSTADGSLPARAAGGSRSELGRVGEKQGLFGSAAVGSEKWCGWDQRDTARGCVHVMCPPKAR